MFSGLEFNMKQLEVGLIVKIMAGNCLPFKFLNMKKIFFIFISLIVKSQQLTILDSLDSKPVPYSKIMDGKNLYLTDSLGKYNFEYFPTDEVTIISAGYETKRLKLKSAIVRISPKIINIENVVISQKNFVTDKKLGFDNGKNSMVIDQKREFAVEIKNYGNTTCRIDKILIPFKKSSNKKGYLLFDIYNSNNIEITEKLNNNNYVIPIAILEKNSLFPLKEKIYIEKQHSIYLSVIWVENTYNKSELFSNKIYLNTIPNKTNAKMYVRKSNYNSWNLKPYIENIQSTNSIIPAFKVFAKCAK